MTDPVPPMRVAIVENTRITHHGQVGVALHERAALVDLYKPWSGQPLPQTVDADALVVFGGEQAATDDHSHPYLPDLARLMADYTALDRPVLGICLGSQLLARAYGGDNQLGVTPEFGWVDVSLTEAGRASVNHITEAARLSEQQAAEGFSEKDMRNLLKLLRAMDENLHAGLPDASRQHEKPVADDI